MEQRMALVEPHLHFGLRGGDREVRRPDSRQSDGAFARTFVERLAKTRVARKVSFLGSFRDRLTLLRRGGRNEQATNAGECEELAGPRHVVLRWIDGCLA